MTALLQDYVSRQAAARPDAVALVMSEVRLTYRELDEASSKLANLLWELGCRRGDRVCLFLSKSPQAVVAMIACLKVGCAYVPIDLASPAARVEKIVRAVEPRSLLLCEEAVGLVDQIVASGALPQLTTIVSVAGSPLSGAHFRMTASARDWERFDASPPPRIGSPEDPAHLLFTSGSTGAPKGVVITHSNVVRFVEWAKCYFGITASDRMSGHPPLHFDLSTFDIFGALSAGAELHPVPPEMSVFPQHLAELIRRAELTQFFAVPSALTLMASFGVVRYGDFPTLRRVIWCGEVLPTRTLRYWMERLPHCSFTNLYGPTETTIASSYHTVGEAPASDDEPIPIGVACEGEELLVLDERLLPADTEELGEIYIGGAGLSPGYWKDPERTRRAFVPDPRSPDTSRIYKTGDLGRRGGDGLVYFVGRADSQIKHRGYRIELGEIEAAVNASDEVRECAVVSIETEGFEGTKICCAYVSKRGSGDRGRELREALRSSLPQYMLPTKWLRLDALPKNPNGKIDRPRLRGMFERVTQADPGVTAGASADAGLLQGGAGR